MATVFSGGTYINTTIDGSSKTSIITGMQTQLTAAGWSVVSGSGTTNLLMETAQDATTGNRGRVRFKDNGGNCVQVTIENHSGSAIQTSSTSSGGNLFSAAALTYRILASRYRFEIYTSGSSPAREFVCAGILYIPTPYQGVITEAIYLQANSINDTDTAQRGSFRTTLGNGQPNCASIVNGNLLNISNDGNDRSGRVQIRVPSVGGLNNPSINSANLYRWHDQALDMADPLIGWGTSLSSDEALIRGQAYDWTVISDSFAADLTDSWTDGGASHNWTALTVGNTGSGATVRGTIWVATS